MKLNREKKQFRRHAGVVLIGSLFAVPAVHAFEIDTGNSDVKMLWDTTVKYSAAYRLDNQSATLTAAPFANFPNTDDGDRNFNKGIISNRADLLSEFDFSYHGFGARISGAAWYDTVYNRSNDNNSPATANQTSVPYNQFTSATRTEQGQGTQLLDAFVFGKADLGATKATFRAGQYTLLWGESLFFGGNGIANGQGPVNVAKLLSVPNTQFKELIIPVPQLSAQLQVNPDLSFGAYYQMRWKPTELPPVGSYFSSVDFVGDGGERLIVGGAGGPFAAAPAFFHGQDIAGSNSGQGGLQMRFRAGDVDYGLYAIRYNEKAPEVYLRPSAVPNFATGQIGNYALVYPDGIKSFGASASTTVGDVNFAGEVSIRRNTPLTSGAAVDLTGTGNNSSNVLYAVGNSAHAQMSWLASLGPSFISREADFLGEIAWNRLTSVTKNPAELDPDATRDATNIRMAYEPKYRQVLPGLDLSVPIGFGYGISGNSAVVGSFNGKHVGDLSIGVAGSYLDVWRFSLNWTHYMGPTGTAFDPAGNFSYKQTLADRDFVSMSIRRTF